MSAGSLTAAGVFAHAAHLGLLLLGFLAVLGLTLPGWLQARAARNGAQKHASTAEQQDLQERP